MSLKSNEQLLPLIERATEPLIVLPAVLTPDAIATATALSFFLSKLNKKVTIASAGGPAPTNLAFLELKEPIAGDLAHLRKMTLLVNASETKVDHLSYSVENGVLAIHLQPKSGIWKEEDVVIKTDSYRHDLIFSIGATTLSQHGAIFENYKDFFFDTPVVNIDHTIENEFYGQVDLVDVNAVSSSEVLFAVLKDIDAGIIDEKIATALLAGMIAKTNSFKSHRVTPKTLKVAGELMALGANRDLIMERLYKTRSVETLRLWGRALTRLQSDKERGITWTALTKQDFISANADESALNNILEELIATSPDAKVSLVFFEHGTDEIEIHVRAERPHDALLLVAPFGAYGGREFAEARLKNTDLLSAEKRVVEHVRKTVDEIAR